MCVVSGRHMERDDWCLCPISKMPALYSQYSNYVRHEMRAARDRAMKNEARGAPAPGQLEVLDPVCRKPVSLDMLSKLDAKEVDAYLASWNKTAEKEDDKKAKDAKDPKKKDQ